MARTTAAPKRTTNISLGADLIEEAKRLNIDISQACECRLEEQVAKTHAKQWRKENREAIDYWNDYVEKQGLPLSGYRLF